jgi:hypothetical protein
MPDKRPKGSHDPSQKSLQRWNNEGGAPKSGRLKRPRDPAQLAKLMIDIASGKVEDREPTAPPDDKDTAAVSLGRRGGLKGGKARAAKMTPEQRRESARKAVAARWSKSRGT